jgi:hypothetical protein
VARYGLAQDVVQELEQAGMGGEQVEVITDIDEDVRTESTPNERLTKPPEVQRSKWARLFGIREKPDVRDEAGEMPNYIGEQEFYANHVKAGGAVLVVRVDHEKAANQAASILQAHGGRAPGEKGAPVVRRIE